MESNKENPSNADLRKIEVELEMLNTRADRLQNDISFLKKEFELFRESNQSGYYLSRMELRILREEIKAGFERLEKAIEELLK